MSQFPALKTGAVMQYPADREVVHSTRVVEFVDGSEQRFREAGRPVRKWLIDVKLLDEDEIERLLQFVREVGGSAETFPFTDPEDGRTYPQCRFGGDRIEILLAEGGRCGTWLVVREREGVQ